MIIHIVRPGETLQSIAALYGVPAEKLLADNGLSNDSLVVGQSLVIVQPSRVYTVQEGDTLDKIAAEHNISLIQLLANNPFLADRKYIYPGDTLVISYAPKRSLTSHGFSNTNITYETLAKTLPNLTYLSIVNYTAVNGGEIIVHSDETELINITKAYDVVPLLFLTILTARGVANIRVDNDLILNEEFQDRQIENILNLLQAKGYSGLNLSLQYISISNIEFYESYLRKVTTRFIDQGYEVFVTINPNISNINEDFTFPRVDYSPIDILAKNTIFMTFEQPFNVNIPSPISSIQKTDRFLQFILNYIPPEKIIIGIATLGYDWELPYAAGISSVNPISFNNIINQAVNTDSVIQFDEESKTPFFIYTTRTNTQHIVWFMDAVAINATLDLIVKYNLGGFSVWNINVYNPQLWLIVNSQFEIEKVSD